MSDHVFVSFAFFYDFAIWFLIPPYIKILDFHWIKAMHVITCICKIQPRCPRDHILNFMSCNTVKTCACLNQGKIFGGIIEIYHACKWYLPKNTGCETRQICLAYRLGKFFQSLNQYFFGKYRLHAWYISIKTVSTVWYFIFFIFKITQCCFISSFPGGHSPIFFL